MSVNEELRDRAIRHALKLSRYSNGLVQQIIALLNSVDDELVGKIAGRLATIEERGITLSSRTTKRLQTLLDEVRAVNAAAYAEVGKTLSDQLVGLSGVEAAYQVDAIASALPIKLGVSVPSPTLLRTIVETSPIGGSILSDWVDGLETDRIVAMEQAIRKGLVLGSSTDDIVRSIRGTKKLNYGDGVLQISRRKAQTLVRTSVTHVTNVSAQATWQKNSDILKGWQFIATLDSRTSITCASNSGKIFEIGKGPIPPLHPNCRSTTIAVTKSFKELGLDADELTDGQRASMDGQIVKDISFTQWLKNKGEKVQNDILGKARAELFRSGKLSLDDFVKNDGTVLTLEQLRKLHNLSE